MDPDELLKPKQLAAEFKLSHRSMERWRVKGTGPPYVQLQPQGPVRYRRREAKAWLEARLMISTSTPAAPEATTPLPGTNEGSNEHVVGETRQRVPETGPTVGT